MKKQSEREKRLKKNLEKLRRNKLKLKKQGEQQRKKKKDLTLKLKRSQKKLKIFWKKHKLTLNSVRKLKKQWHKRLQLRQLLIKQKLLKSKLKKKKLRCRKQPEKQLKRLKSLKNAKRRLRLNTKQLMSSSWRCRRNQMLKSRNCRLQVRIVNQYRWMLSHLPFLREMTMIQLIMKQSFLRKMHLLVHKWRSQLCRRQFWRN